MLCLAQAGTTWVVFHLLGRPPTWRTQMATLFTGAPSEAVTRLASSVAAVQGALTDLTMATGGLSERLVHVEGEVAKVAIARRIQIVQTKCEQAAQQSKAAKAEAHETRAEVTETKEAVQQIASEAGAHRPPVWQFWKHCRFR